MEGSTHAGTMQRMEAMLVPLAALQVPHDHEVMGFSTVPSLAPDRLDLSYAHVTIVRGLCSVLLHDCIRPMPLLWREREFRQLECESCCDHAL